jgi:predicted TIM-barrel fold metal-dependent hydrolase
MTIIDVHSHIGYDWETDTYDIDGLIDDTRRHGIDVRVVSALEGGTDTARGNDVVATLSTTHPGQFLGCAILNPKQTDAVAETERVVNLPGISMVEFNSYDHGYFPELAPRLPAMLDIIDRAGIPVKVFTGIGAHSLPHQWVRHAQRHPNVPFILLHCGCFDYGYGCVDLAAEQDNLWIETSNQYEVQILNRLFERVPTERILFGTSFPERFTSSGLGIFDGFGLTDQQLASVLGGNAERLLAGDGRRA